MSFLKDFSTGRTKLGMIIRAILVHGNAIGFFPLLADDLVDGRSSMIRAWTSVLRSGFMNRMDDGDQCRCNQIKGRPKNVDKVIFWRNTRPLGAAVSRGTDIATGSVRRSGISGTAATFLRRLGFTLRTLKLFRIKLGSISNRDPLGYQQHRGLATQWRLDGLIAHAKGSSISLKFDRDDVQAFTLEFTRRLPVNAAMVEVFHFSGDTPVPETEASTRRQSGRPTRIPAVRRERTFVSPQPYRCN